MELKWRCKLCGKTIRVTPEAADLGIDDKEDPKIQEALGAASGAMRILQMERETNRASEDKTKEMFAVLTQSALWTHLMLEHNDKYDEMLKQNFEKLKEEV